MEQWKYITVMVTVVAFALEIRPLDSFLTAYLTSKEVHVSLEEVSSVLTPIRVYLGVFGALLVFLLTDYFLYKPVVVFNGLLGMVAYFNFIDSPDLPHLVVAESCLSLYMCTEVAYFGYLYAKIKDKEHYQLATGCAKAGTLSGKCASGLIGQLFVFSKHGYEALPYYSFFGATFAFAWACFLPSVKHGRYFHVADDVTFSKTAIRRPDVSYYTAENFEPQNRSRNVETTRHVNLFRTLYDDFLHSYADPTVRRWSFWHIFGMAGYMQIFLYINILYTYVVDVSDDPNVLLNGLVDSVTTMCGAICAYNVGKVNVNWSHYGDAFLAFGSLTLGLTMCSCAYLGHIIYVYIMYIVYGTLVQSMFVISISQIATRLKENSYALVLGFNAFAAVLLATCLSLFLVQLIGVSIPTQFLFYGGIYVVLGVLYGCADVFKEKPVNFNRLP